MKKKKLKEINKKPEKKLEKEAERGKRDKY